MHGHEVFVCRSRSKIYTPMSNMGATAGIMTSFGIKFLEGEMIKLSRFRLLPFASLSPETSHPS
jgi:hypothetical protein